MSLPQNKRGNQGMDWSHYRLNSDLRTIYRWTQLETWKHLKIIKIAKFDWELL